MSASLVAERDPPARQIVGAQLDAHFVADEDADVEFAHLAGGVGENLLAGEQLHLEHRVGQGLDNRGIHLDRLLLGLCCDSGGGRVAAACGTATACAAGTRWTSCQEDLPEMARIEPHSLLSVARPPSTPRLTETKSPLESREVKERECPNSRQCNVDHFSERSVSASSFLTAASAPACSHWNQPQPISGARHWWAGWTAWCCMPRTSSRRSIARSSTSAATWSRPAPSRRRDCVSASGGRPSAPSS